jgi:hypothetical protein
MPLHILGIRHHGPGSARNIKAHMDALRPDIILVEGPPDADHILQWAAHEDFIPPAAILVFNPEKLSQAAFYPFAEFSPEWQAIRYAQQNDIPVRFMDLPATYQFALQKEEDNKEQATPLLPEGTESEKEEKQPLKTYDKLSYLARAAGFTDTELWWEHQFEYRTNSEQVFEAVAEAMSSLRETFTDTENRKEQLREAWMRKTIREAQKEGYENIAIICGAWHAPALTQSSAKEDNALLKGMAKVKTDATWIPWTYDRLSFASGYGAGINSPGWYEHIWHHPTDDGSRWLIKVAKLLRSQQMDISVAHVIEAVRLAENLAILRQLHKPGLEELNEAVLTVLCNGEEILLKLIQDELIVSNKIGSIPVEIPKPPLQLDIEKLQKTLRLPATADSKELPLDLRKDQDLQRSIFLHRLLLLDIEWGHQLATSGKGTFKEHWRLQWRPEFSIQIIEKGKWGNTLESASASYLAHEAKNATRLQQVSSLLVKALPAELPEAIHALIRKVEELAAATGDVIQLMEVVPGLVSITRYGNVRKTDAQLVLDIIRSMITRICISLPPAATAIDEDAAQELLNLIMQSNDAVSMLDDNELLKQWQEALQKISVGNTTSPVLAGYATRLLFDYKLVSGPELVKAFHFAMSAAILPNIAAAWLEGFLKGSGTILLLDEDLWSVVNGWVKHLEEETFMQVLPLLRRTFSNFSSPERRKLGEKLKTGSKASPLQAQEKPFDHERAKESLPIVFTLLGLKPAPAL